MSDVSSIKSQSVFGVSATEFASVSKQEAPFKPKEIVTQNFARHQDDYRAEMSRPQLQAPEKTLRAKDPLTSREQRVVKYDFERHASERIAAYGLSTMDKQLVLNAVVNPEKEVSLSSTLQSIANDVTKQSTKFIQKQYQLPEEWSINSQKAEHWIPSKSPALDRVITHNAEKQQQINQQYQDLLHKNAEIYIKDLTKEGRSELISGLRDGLRTGVPSKDILPDYNIIKDVTVEAIRHQHLLPGTWVPFSTNEADWKSLPPGSVDPIAAARLSNDNFLLNAEKYGMEVIATSKSIASEPNIPESFKQQSARNEPNVYQAMKKAVISFRLLQLDDMRLNEKIATNQEMLSKLSLEFNEQLLKEQESIQSMQQTFGALFDVVKYIFLGLSIAITAVCIVKSIVTIPLDFITLGATAGLKAALLSACIGLVGVAIGLVVIGASVADAQFGITAKIGEAFNTGLDACLRFIPDNMLSLKTFIKSLAIVLVLVVVAAIVAAITFFTKGSGSSAAMNTFKSFMLKMINTIFTQAQRGVTGMLIGASVGAISQSVMATIETILVLIKAPPQVIHWVTMILGITVTLLVLVFVVIAVSATSKANTGGLKGFIKSILPRPPSIANLKEMGKNILEGNKYIYADVGKVGGLKGAAQQVKHAFDCIKLLRIDFTNNLAAAAANLQEALKLLGEAGAATAFSPTRFIEGSEQLAENLLGTILGCLEADFENKSGTFEQMIKLIETAQEETRTNFDFDTSARASMEDFVNGILRSFYNSFDSRSAVINNLINSA